MWDAYLTWKSTVVFYESLAFTCGKEWVNSVQHVFDADCFIPELGCTVGQLCVCHVLKPK